MKKVFLLGLFVFMMMGTNAQTKQMFFAEYMGNGGGFKIHSSDSCTTIKNSFFDDKTEYFFYDRNKTRQSYSPYYLLTDDYRLFFCHKCMNDALIKEFKNRCEKYNMGLPVY